jgi:hypothetical protein
MAAMIRAIKKPEPYHGKGIRYQGEVIVLRVLEGQEERVRRPLLAVLLVRLLRRRNKEARITCTRFIDKNAARPASSIFRKKAKIHGTAHPSAYLRIPLQQADLRPARG